VPSDGGTGQVAASGLEVENLVGRPGLAAVEAQLKAELLLAVAPPAGGGEVISTCP
jgi:hypothetical protein